MTKTQPIDMKELAILASEMMGETLNLISTDVGISYVMTIAHSRKVPKLCVVLHWTEGQIELSLRYQMEDWREPIHKFMDHELPPAVVALREAFPNMSGSVAYIDSIDCPALTAVLEM